MKINFKSYLFLLFAGLIGMSSCKDDEETTPVPTLTFTYNGATSGSFNSAEVAEFKMDLNSSADFTALKGTLTYKNASGSTSTITLKDNNNSDKSLDYTKNSDIQSYKGAKIVKVVLPSDAKSGEEWTISVSATNAGGNSTATFKGKIVNLWPTQTLGGQDLNAPPSFYNSSTGQRTNGTTSIANPAGIDITYAIIGDPAVPTILSFKQRATDLPDETKPNGAEEAYFVQTELTPSDFTSNTKSWASYFSGVTFGNNQKVTVSEGNIYAFKNKSGKKGLIHIANINQGTNTFNGTISINVKAEN